MEEPGSDYFCPVSVELLKEPQQTIFCCGNHLSREVAERLEAERKPCQKGPIKTLEDLFFKRKVMELKIYCGNKGNGCKWVGELGELDTHNGKCGFVLVECPLQCGQRVYRHYLTKHKSDQCHKRPFSCQYCGHEATFEKVVNDHWPTCQSYPELCPNLCSHAEIERRFLQQHLNEECPLQEIECEFSYAGCEKMIRRQSMQKHLDQSKDEHLKMRAQHKKKNRC